MRLANYHTHTDFCDGGNTAEEMVNAAIESGMTDLGFSAHAAWFFSTEWHMASSRYAEYTDEIARLKEKHKKQITILCGFEADYIPGITAPDPAFYARFSPDFLIGSVHYVLSDMKKKHAGLWSADASAEEVARGLEQCFENDGKRAVQAYWRAVREMTETCSFDIIGHLDVIRKRNAALRFFDESASWYRRELALTAKAIARSGKIVELNTGGLSRKAFDGIYPSDDLLAVLHAQGVPITLSSDAHSASHLTFAYDKAREAAREAGYATLSYNTCGVWIQEPF